MRAAVQFATANNLAGIVSYARPFVACPELVREIKAAGKADGAADFDSSSFPTTPKKACCC